ncbi:hypothetical protein EDC04DRAFT_2605921 [Pisolithus marmoratus]|nr:hypothetical protein EDC04DRAFT_2605921 [Pisolithus marmoratus]
MQKAPAENPHSEATANTAVVIRSMESNLVDNPCPVAAANTTIVSSMGSNLGKHPAPVDTAQVNTPPLSDNACKPFISSKVILKELDYSSSLCNNLYNFMQEQMKECNELIKTFEGAQLTIKQQHNSALAQVWGELEGGAQVIRCRWKCQVCTVGRRAWVTPAEKEAQFVALMQKFEGTLCQVEASRSQIQMQKEAEVVALAQKFEDALHQVEASKSQIQTEKETKVAALAQKFEGALHQEHVRELFGNIFLVTRDEDFLSHESPSHEVVMSFTEGNSPGPDPINLQWDFTSPVSSLWNQAVIEILLDKLHALCTEEKWTTKPRSDKYWKEAIKQKFNQIKVIWTKGRPKRLKTGILETPAQVVARLMHTKMDDLKTTWKDTWGVAHLMRCAEVLLSFNCHKVIFMHRNGMRDQGDSKHKDQAISSPKGAKPVKQIRPSNPFPLACQPVCGLPATFYKPEWLEGNPTFKSDKVFEWSQFIVQGI